MKTPKANKVLKDFSDKIELQAKANLNKSSNTGTLSNSIDVGFEEATDGIRIYINMEEYGEFLDEGVKGANPNLVKMVDRKHQIVNINSQTRCRHGNLS